MSDKKALFRKVMRRYLIAAILHLVVIGLGVYALTVHNNIVNRNAQLTRHCGVVKKKVADKIMVSFKDLLINEQYVRPKPDQYKTISVGSSVCVVSTRTRFGEGERVSAWTFLTMALGLFNCILLLICINSAKNSYNWIRYDYSEE